MYRKIEPALRMTANEASERYPDIYIVIQMDSMKFNTDIMASAFSFFAVVAVT